MDVWLPGLQCAAAGSLNAETGFPRQRVARSCGSRRLLTGAGEVPRMVAAGGVWLTGKDSEDEEGEKGHEGGVHDCESVGFCFERGEVGLKD